MPLLASPETVPDALLIVRALGEPHVAGHLTQKYGEDAIASTRAVANTWMDIALVNALPDDVVYEPYRATQKVPGSIDLETTCGFSPEEEEALHAEPEDSGVTRVWGPEPQPFSTTDTDVILDAIRLSVPMQRRWSDRRERLQYLIGHSPKPAERQVARVALGAYGDRYRTAPHDLY